MTRLLDRVRRAAEDVAARADHVRVDRERLAELASSLRRLPMELPPLEPETHHLGHGEETVAFLLTLDAVNFGSGYFPELRPFMERTGYFAVAAALRHRYLEEGPLGADELAALQPQDCARIFGQRPDGSAGELMASFAASLNELGALLLERFGGSFAALLDAAGGSAERLVELLAELPSFHDVSSYKGLEVPILKRAQISAADLSLALGEGSFGDLERLTVFADCTVPHVLRLDGVLRYSEALAGRIDAEEPIAAGSGEEVEIRAVALHACELLLAELRRRGRRVLAMQLDYFLWNRGQEPRYAALPSHLTRTIYY